MSLSRPVRLTTDFYLEEVKESQACWLTKEAKLVRAVLLTLNGRKDSVREVELKWLVRRISKEGIEIES